MAAQMSLEMHESLSILIVETKARMERLLGLMDSGLAVQQVEKQASRSNFDGTKPARLLSQRADEGHSKRDGRRFRFGSR